MSRSVTLELALTDREFSKLANIAEEGGFLIDDIVQGVIKQYLQEDDSKPIEFRRKHGLLPEKTGILATNDQSNYWFASVSLAAQALKLHKRLIYAVLHGKRKQTGGYSFKYQAPKK